GVVAPALVSDELGAKQGTQVAAHGRRRDAGQLGQLTGRVRSLAQPLEHSAADGVAECLERGSRRIRAHEANISHNTQTWKGLPRGKWRAGGRLRVQRSGRRRPEAAQV